MKGVLVNCLTILVGGIIGCCLRGGIPEKYRNIINNGLALCVMIIGISGAIEANNMVIVIVSLVIGSVLGEMMHIHQGVERLGDWAQKRFSKGDSGFSAGFVNATLLFCVGAMAVVGSLDAGLLDKHDTLYAKAVLDGVSSIIFASTFGAGVILSIVPLFIYQGGIAVLAQVIAPFMTDALITEMSAVGSLLIIGIGMNMLSLTKKPILVANMLPSMFVPFALLPLVDWISGLI